MYGSWKSHQKKVKILTKKAPCAGIMLQPKTDKMSELSVPPCWRTPGCVLEDEKWIRTRSTTCSEACGHIHVGKAVWVRKQGDCCTAKSAEGVITEAAYSETAEVDGVPDVRNLRHRVEGAIDPKTSERSPSGGSNANIQTSRDANDGRNVRSRVRYVLLVF